jgi:hypothetical protein
MLPRHQAGVRSGKKSDSRLALAIVAVARRDNRSTAGG